MTLEQSYVEGGTAVKISDGIERAVREGRLLAGDRLPTVRELAELGAVSHATAAAAYRRLRGRGTIITAGRRGTRVSDRPALVGRRAPPLPREVRNLAAGNPDPALLPELGPALRALDPRPRLYGERANLPALLALAERDLRGSGLPAGPVTIVSGGLDGIERTLQAHLRPGDAVAVEDPGFPDAIDLVRALGLEPVPVAVDDEGPVPDALAFALESGVAGCIFTPRAQNPTGAALSAARERTLRRLLDRHPDVLVIEDDYAGPIAGSPARSTAGGKRRRWAIVRSVSKFLGPDLRLAFLTGDAETVARVEGRQRLGTSWVSHILQAIVARLLAAKGTARLLARATRTYARRREALRAALEARDIDASGVAGLHLWIPVSDESFTVQSLLESGWGVAAGERFRIRSESAIRVTFAGLEPADAEQFADDLAAALGGHGRTHAA